MTFTILLLALAFGTGWAARMDGGGPPVTPEWFERFLVTAPITAFGAVFGWVGLTVAALSIFAKSLGHGQYFLSRAVKATEPEKVDLIIRIMFGRDPRTFDQFKQFRGDGWKNVPDAVKDQIAQAMASYGLTRLYWRNVVGMAITGSLVTLPLSGLLAYHGEAFAAVLALLAGTQKAISYMLGYWAYTSGFYRKLPDFLNGETESAEFLNGFNMTLLLGAALMVLRCFLPLIHI